jgi:hypothetical protein
MSQRFLIADACSIINFAAVNRMPLFELSVRGRGRWTQAVAGEVRRLASRAEYRPARALLGGGCLGDPIELDRDEDRESVEDIRAALGGVASAPLKHLGEAESIHAIESRPDLAGAIFLTDDRDAAYLAAIRGIAVKNTTWLITDAYSMGDLQCPEPFNVLVEMWEAERGVALPSSHESVCP